MPIYEYNCPSCGRRFEEIRRMEDREGAPCPDCGAASKMALSRFSAVTGSCRSSGGDCGSESGSCCSGLARRSSCEGGGSCGCQV